MRRALVALATLATAAFTALTLAAPAGAATNTEVIHYKDLSAGAFWSTTTTNSAGTTVTNSNVQVTESTQGWSQLYANQFISYYGADGTFRGAKETWGFAGSGFTLSINRGLISASASDTDLLGTMVTYDENWSQSDYTFDVPMGEVNATWTGQGQVTSSGYHSTYHDKGYTRVETSRGTSRPATATGTVGGLTFGTGDLVLGQLGNLRTGTITITVGH